MCEKTNEIQKKPRNRKKTEENPGKTDLHLVDAARDSSFFIQGFPINTQRGLPLNIRFDLPIYQPCPTLRH